VPISFEAIHWPGCCWVTTRAEAPPALAVGEEEPDAAGAAADAVDPAPLADEPEPGWLVADALEPLLDPDGADPDRFVGAEPPEEAGLPPTAAPALGCMAGEPEVVEPEPMAAGRSVAPEGGGGLDCANPGAAANAVATRQAAICDFNIDCLPKPRVGCVALGVNVTPFGIVPAGCAAPGARAG
jgi:hypothetical protein